jgi:hypothetical protein
MWGDLAHDDALRRVIAVSVKWPMLRPCQFDEEELFDLARHGPRTYAAVLDTMLSVYATRHGKPRWSEKTPLQEPGMIWHLFPDAKVVHIVRDPRECIASNLKLPWVEGTAVSLARWWHSFTLASIFAGANKGCTQYLRIRYEDLARDPHTALKLVCSFLDEPFEPEMVSDQTRRRGDIPDASKEWIGAAQRNVEPKQETWRTALTGVQRARVNDIVRPLLPGLGYQLPRRRTVLVGAACNLTTQPLERMKVRRRRNWAKHATPEQRLARELETRLRKKQLIDQALASNSVQPEAAAAR